MTASHQDDTFAPEPDARLTDSPSIAAQLPSTTGVDPLGDGRSSRHLGSRGSGSAGEPNDTAVDASPDAEGGTPPLGRLFGGAGER